ncbi:LysR family transcriptional regulator [Glutamicibacter halophytocola]|uniref:LysR family transcriptional regulator n=1 Tax=Glutamicibacter halophytocola TaxID=1933880 RepID=UPI0032195FA0
MANQPDLSAVSLPQIAAVITVVDYGSFTAAADILGISQPSLSRRIQSLEQGLGLPIFRAAGRTMQLTEAGRAIVPAARRILDELASINALGASTRELKTGSLRIAGLPSLIGSVLPEYAGKFHQKHPGVHLEILSVQDHDELLEAIRLGSADAAFGVSHAVPADLETQLVCHQEFSAVLPAGLDGANELNAQLLSKLTLVSLPQPTSIRKVTDEVYRSLGRTPPRIITTVRPRCPGAAEHCQRRDHHDPPHHGQHGGSLWRKAAAAASWNRPGHRRDLPTRPVPKSCAGRVLALLVSHCTGTGVAAQ